MNETRQDTLIHETAGKVGLVFRGVRITLEPVESEEVNRLRALLREAVPFLGSYAGMTEYPYNAGQAMELLDRVREELGE